MTQIASAATLRILIADDHDLLRDMLEMFLGGEDGIETRTAADLDEVRDILTEDPQFDLVLLDYAMPGMNGLDGLDEIRARPGPHRVAVISGTATPAIAREVLARGAAGFVPKTLSAKSLINAVRFMAIGEQYAPHDFLNAPETGGERNALTELLSPRELDVLRGLTEGKSNKEIGRDLNIREPTVKLHVKTLYRKMGVANRTQAALTARGQGLF